MMFYMQIISKAQMHICAQFNFKWAGQKQTPPFIYLFQCKNVKVFKKVIIKQIMNNLRYLN